MCIKDQRGKHHKPFYNYEVIKDLNLDMTVPILIFRHGFEDHLIYFSNYGRWKGKGCDCLWVITKLDR